MMGNAYAQSDAGNTHNKKFTVSAQVGFINVTRPENSADSFNWGYSLELSIYMFLISDFVGIGADVSSGYNSLDQNERLCLNGGKALAITLSPFLYFNFIHHSRFRLNVPLGFGQYYLGRLLGDFCTTSKGYRYGLNMAHSIEPGINFGSFLEYDVTDNLIVFIKYRHHIVYPEFEDPSHFDTFLIGLGKSF